MYVCVWGGGGGGGVGEREKREQGYKNREGKSVGKVMQLKCYT